MKEATITKGKTVQRELAFEYAKRNVPVFPCVAEGMEEYRYVKGKGYVLKNIKEPLTIHGHKDATTDRAQIEDWWNRWPDALVAIPTGKRSGRMVVDVDDLEEYEKLGHPPIPDTYLVSSPGGGLHYYLKYEEGISNSEGSFKTKTDDGENIFDIRGEGGYVIAPNNPGYGVINNPGKPAKMPEWLLKGLRSPKKVQRGRGKGIHTRYGFQDLSRQNHCL